MPLPAVAGAREHCHTRSIELNAFRRADDLLDLELHLVDIKPYDCPLESGVRPAHEPVHDMWIRLTIDRDYAVVDVNLAVDRMPYPPFCAAIVPDYKRLIGLNLRRHFRLQVAQLFAGTAGCAHLTEMFGLFPTAAVQSFFEKPIDDGAKPFQLDRCHALDTQREAVRRYYPRWFRGEPKTVRAVLPGPTQCGPDSGADVVESSGGAQ